jgi:glycosyltransferase involved in cell wall biosynthesis
MRVALLTRSAHPLHAPGGMERAVYHLACQLHARGVETILVTRPATQPERFPGEVISVPYGPEAGHGKVLDRTLRYPRFSHRVGAVVADLVRAGRVDLVDAQGLTALGYARLRRADASLRAPLLMNPQGMEEHKTQGLKRLALTRLRALSREAARLADRVVATDAATRDEVPRLLGVAASRVVVLPNGLDLDEIARLTPADARARAELAVPALRGASPVFVSVGRLEGYKGFGDLRAAFEQVAARLPERWAWVIVGAGVEAAPLEAGLGPGLRGHVHLAGRVSEALLHALYARADAFVHATRYEGSSLVTLEAMAHALPVLATRAGGIPDKVLDGTTGRLVAPGDVAALSRGLLELSADGDRRRQWGAAGERHLRAHFGWPVLIDGVLAESR